MFIPMSETNGKKMPSFVSWGVLWLGLVLAVTGTWWQRGSVADQQSLRESNAALVREQANLSARLSLVEQAIQEQRVDMRWIIEAIRRDEFRKGYTPPPPPSP